MLKLEELEVLACPQCHSSLRFRGTTKAGLIDRGALICDACSGRWLVDDQIAQLFREKDVTGSDRFMRSIYNQFCHIHDLSVKVLLPLFQRGTEEQFRSAYMPRLELGALRARSDGRPLRILEVGVGAGANLPRIRKELPPGLEVELWGLDLSPGMIGVLRRNLEREGSRDVRLLLADVHALPFPDHSFDRVFHVGGVNGFRDPTRALEEMARVAVPGSPILVVDEQLDRSRSPGLYHQAMFKMVTFYDDHPHCPLEAVPVGAVSVVEDQLSLFFFALTFRMPSESQKGADS